MLTLPAAATDACASMNRGVGKDMALSREERDFFVEHVADNLLDVWSEFEADHPAMSVDDLVEVTTAGAARLIAMNIATQWLINGEIEGQLLLSTQAEIFKKARAIYYDDGSHKVRRH